MKRIGLLSDTHSFIDNPVLDFFAGMDEIWHAGDIGNQDVVYSLNQICPVRAVSGNIDDHRIRSYFNEFEIFNCENLKVMMVHVGGYPGKYHQGIKNKLMENDINLFISGHSHILKIMYDKTLGIMHLNPGAAGMSGFHNLRTAIRFVVENQNVTNIQILEISRNQVIN
ncbi:MAG: metallophosphoesterase family protein [Bacteroidales bacterium]